MEKYGDDPDETDSELYVTREGDSCKMLSDAIEIIENRKSPLAY
jgi:hypothetical protein